MQTLIEDSLHPNRNPVEAYHHLYLTSRYLRLLYQRKNYEAIIKVREYIENELVQFKQDLLQIQQPMGDRIYQG